MPRDESGGSASKRFRVALSFAGEKREFVARVARNLADRFGDDRILYDKFHEAEFARDDLAFYLPALYHDQSDLIVGVFCPDYEKKEWCGLEYKALFDLIKKGRSKEVMLARFGDIEGWGLFSLAGYIDLHRKTAEETAVLILERLALNEGRTRDHYIKPPVTNSATPRTSIPHNLPSLQPFFGRESELGKIADALDPESRTWGALIDGPGGMGKTSLAVRAAYDAPAGAFERIVFISLKSRELDDDGVRDLSCFLIGGLAELFNELARELGHADIPQQPEEQRPRLLLHALRDTRTLLVLDNLESLLKRERDTIFTFVKKLPAGCKAILTARERIGSGAEELILERLGEAAALATLAKLAETSPALARVSEAERRVLYRETAGKPLLLRWVAGQIGRGRCVTFADAIAYLRSCPEGNDPLEFTFGDLVGSFSEAEMRTLCALTYFTLPAKVEHVAMVAGHDETETEFALRSLINRSLAVPSEELKTFALVPLVADFLRVKKPEVLRETGDRMEKHAYALVVENGFEMHNRFPVLDAAWPTVAAALPRFLAGENERLQNVCDALDAFLAYSGRWDELLILAREAETRAVLARDFLNAGWRVKSLGFTHYLRKQTAEMLECIERLEAHWRNARVTPLIWAIAIKMRGHWHFALRNYPGAITAYREAVELDRASGVYHVGLAASLNSLANAEAECGNDEAAEEHYSEALRIARAIPYPQAIAVCTTGLAKLALKRNDLAGAESLAREALLLFEKLGRLDMIAENSDVLAKTLVRQDRKGEALAHARRAVEIYQRLDASDLASALPTLTECEN
jgi:tetratricopeptide (TPR) repeat protein